MNEKIGVIIVNFNNIKDTLECIKSIRNSSFKNIEILVVDNSDKEHFSQKGVKTIRIENKGYGDALNHGLNYFRKRKVTHIFLINNDVVLEKHCLYELLQSSKNHISSIISPAVLYFRKNKVQNTGGNISILMGGAYNLNKNKYLKDLPSKISPGFLNGCAIFGSRADIMRVGSFDTVFFLYFEDTDWSYNAKKNGFSLMVDTGAIIFHKQSKSTGKNNLKDYYIGLSLVLFAKKQLTSWKRRFFLFSAIFIQPILQLVYFKSYKKPLFYLKGLIAGFKFNLVNGGKSCNPK